MLLKFMEWKVTVAWVGGKDFLEKIGFEQMGQISIEHVLSDG